MKDFYDVALLARNFDFDGEQLVRAIRATFGKAQDRASAPDADRADRRLRKRRE